MINVGSTVKVNTGMSDLGQAVVREVRINDKGVFYIVSFGGTPSLHMFREEQVEVCSE